jgi:predicted heme/steroid binding protein
MTATLATISSWVRQGVAEGSRWVIIVCDRYDYTNYPLYVAEDGDFYQVYDSHNGPNMTSVDEVYDLKLDIEAQLKQHRALHLPEREMEGPGLTL